MQIMSLIEDVFAANIRVVSLVHLIMIDFCEQITPKQCLLSLELRLNNIMSSSHASSL